MQRHLDTREAWNERAVAAQAAAIGVGLVATNDVRYATPRERLVHDVLTCAREKRTVDEIGRRLLPNGERWLKSPREMAALFADRPAAVRATRAIAERCQFSLADLGYTFPRYAVPDGETEQSYLEKLCEAGVGHRYAADDPLRPKVRAQLARELGIIGRLGLAGYFLLVWDIVEVARQKNIMIQGRGSAANSAACYVLGITAVDPVKMELLFERFLSEERVQNAGNVADRMPDIDLDLPSGDAREQMIQHVYAKYGRARRRHDRQRDHLPPADGGARRRTRAGLLRGAARTHLQAPARLDRRRRIVRSPTTSRWRGSRRASGGRGSPRAPPPRCSICRVTSASTRAGWCSRAVSSTRWCRWSRRPWTSASSSSGTRTTAPISAWSRSICSASA